MEELQRSIPSMGDSKIHGKYRRLSPFEDKDGVWRIGHRLRDFVPFTKDRKPPMFVPY